MKRPMIGVVPLYDEKKVSYWMLPGYMTGLEAAGAAPVMLPLTGDQEVILQLINQLDGLLLTGGHDIDPGLYGETRLPECGKLCLERDRMEAIAVSACLNADKPLLGICRGLQFLNVLLGGTLYQDIPTQKPSKVNHQMTPPYDRTVHPVRVEPKTLLYEILGKDELAVNSYHHQGIKTLAPPLRSMAAAEDGLIEAAYHPDKTFAAAVQWHPEFSWQKDEDSRKLFEAFTQACQLIPDRDNKGTAGYADIIKLAESVVDENSDSYRQEFLELVKQAYRQYD